jgi:hypothetical protein
MTIVSRVCAEPGCPAFAVDRGRCPAHRQTTVERGYGKEHLGARHVLAGTLPRFCAYGCGTWLSAADPWVAAHVEDGDPTAGWVVGCVPCNQRAKRTGSGAFSRPRSGSRTDQSNGRRSLGARLDRPGDPPPPGVARAR